MMDHLGPLKGGGSGGREYLSGAEGPFRYSEGLARLVGAFAVLVLTSWVLDVPRGPDLLPGLPKVVPLTALSFLVTSICLLEAARWRQAVAGQGRSRRRLAIVATLLLALASVRLGQAIFAFPFIFDRFPLTLWLDEARLAAARMAPAGAFNFALLALAFLLFPFRRCDRAYQVLVFGTLLIACLSLGPLLYGGEPLIALAQMSVPTTLLFLLTGWSALMLRPDRGLVRLALAASAGGTLVRKLLLPALAVPLLVGWLRLQGELYGLYEPRTGLAVFALSNVVFFGGLVWLAADRLDRADLARLGAEGRILRELERLQLLHQVTRATAERLDPQSIYRKVLADVETKLAVDFSCICLRESSRDLLVTMVGPRSRDRALQLVLSEGTKLQIDSNGLTRALGGELVYEEDTGAVQAAFARTLAAGGLRSLVLAPLQVEEQVFGVMVAARRTAGAFASGDCEFLRQLCETIALASSHAEVYGALKEAYRELRASQQKIAQRERVRSLGEMASGIAHDINNAIAPAALQAEAVLEREAGLSAQGRNRLEIVMRALADVAHTVSRMQELYRRKRPHEMAPLNLNELVDHVLDLTRSRWNDAPIEVRTRLAADLPWVRGVESEIRDALTNLVINAFDAMPEGGLLTVRTRIGQEVGATGAGTGELTLSGARTVVLEVSDSGVGMDAETRRRCLEPFFTTKGEQGTGLGLPMVLGIANRHDASVEVESEAGKGTRVALIFPAPAMDAPAQQEAPLPRQESIRVLVIDDDPVLLETLSEVLAADAHRVTGCASGREGIAAVAEAKRRNETYDLVLTDLGMPELDGRQVAAAIKEISPATPIVLLTGWGRRMIAEGELPPHVDLLMSKPPRLRDLRRAINHLLTVR